jgi:hypothetical protein
VVPVQTVLAFLVWAVQIDYYVRQPHTDRDGPRKRTYDLSSLGNDVFASGAQIGHAERVTSGLGSEILQVLI